MVYVGSEDISPGGVMDGWVGWMDVEVLIKTVVSVKA
jgi:hypothetical protein